MKRPQVLVNCEESQIPTYETKQSAGADLRSAEDIVIYQGEFAMVNTGLKMAIPAGYEGQVRPRSGLAAKHGISVLNTPGTIDADYRGEVKVMLINFGDEDYQVKKGDRIAQLIITQAPQAVFLNLPEGLSDTERGEGGFGSTGKS